MCFEGQFESLLGELSVHKLDVVLTDRPVPPGTNLRVFSHLLGGTEISLYGLPALVKQYAPDFPASLRGAPMLLPTCNNAVSARIDHWFKSHDVRTNVIGEFDDNALLQSFGRNGRGLFPAPSILAKEVREQFDAIPVGVLQGVREQFYAISTERKIKHPAIEAILTAMHGRVFKKLAESRLWSPLRFGSQNQYKLLIQCARFSISFSDRVCARLVMLPPSLLRSRALKFFSCVMM